MLKIKKGEVIMPYGFSGGSFTDESEVSQAILEHLQTRFPDKIEDTKKKKGAEPEPEIEPDPIVEPEVEEPIVEEVVEPTPNTIEETEEAPVEPEAFDLETSTPEEPIVEIKISEPAKRTRKKKED